MGLSMPLSRTCSDEEVDYLYSLFHGRAGIPEMLIARNMELVKSGRPELYKKLTGG